ncbi:hypothetical protein VTK73DRAFT_10156 [Phialemonium thermophilum]|uniref:Uncharacterized protein n=1 Tax=Phialemonium thermophilum TaxID=223376 RepID=A0ABR3XH78_9PEZI
MSPSVVAAARPLVMRRSALQIGRRLQSTASPSSSASSAASSAASSTQAAASSAASKAAQGLSRVTSSAGPAIVNAAKGITGALSRVGGRTGRLIAFVERQTPLVIYYSKVGLEVAKIVFKGQNMTPPPLTTFQSYFQNLVKQLKNPATLFQRAAAGQKSPSSALQAVRGISRAQLVTGAVVLAECLGFFTVGEMIGRFKLIGYHGENPTAHH